MFSGKMIFFLITSTFLPYTSQNEQIRGVPEVDYPTYYVIPKTSFRCSDQLYNPGFYADTETRCQVFHYCYEHRQESFLCPMGTVFNQPILACDYWYSSNCSIAPSHYRVNADKRNENHFDEADDIIDSHSENLFDKMAHLYETNEAPESHTLENYSDAEENEFLDRDVESSGEPLTEKKDEIKDYNKYSYGDEFNMVDKKHPEVVQYEVRGLNTFNIHKGSENGQLYEKDNVNDFIFSEDGMLHPSQEDIQMYPTDMHFNQDADYAEIPGGENYSYDLNEGIDSVGDSQIPDFLLQKRYTDLNGNYVRRPSSRRPVIVLPEEEPEIVQLPVLKHRRKPIGIASTAGKKEDTESFETNYDLAVFKEGTVSVINEGLENTTFGKLSLDEPSSDLKDLELRDPKLFYEILEKINDENGSQLPETDGLNVMFDYSKKPETQNEFLLSNVKEDETSSDVFESGNHDYLSVSEVEHGNTFINSNYDDDSNIFIGNAVGFSEFPGESFDTASEDESSFDGDLSFGSGLEDINLSHSNDGSSFLEDQDIFSDSEDREITDTEASYVPPMNISDTFDGSGISFQETVEMSNFNEEVNRPIQFVLREDSDDSINYRKESIFSLEASEDFLPFESSEKKEVLELEPEGSGESNEDNYLLHESQDSSNNPQDASDKIEPEIQEIDGSYYYVFSESESNNEYEDSSAIYPQNVDYTVAENFEGVSDKTTEEMIDNEGSRYATMDSKLKMDNVGNGALQTLDYQDSRDLKNNENRVDEFEMEISSDIHENNITDDSDNDRELSTEDLKYLEIMSQDQSPILKNLFEVSYEKPSSDIKEIPSIEISPEKDTNEQADIYEDPSSLEDVNEFEKPDSDTSSAVEQYLVTDIQDSGHDSETLNAESIVEGISNEDGSGENGSELFSEQKLEVIVPVKETDPFNPLFAEGDKIILNDPGSKRILSPKVHPTIPSRPVMGENTKKVSRGKRFDENLRTFKPPNKGNSLAGQSKETFREAMFTNIPSTFLKMKHSYLRPYFYNYGLRYPGFNPRTGDSLESSKFSKLTSLGKRLLAGKSAKFNRMKKFIGSY